MITHGGKEHLSIYEYDQNLWDMFDTMYKDAKIYENPSNFG